jgi:signal peptide peptidase SppA
MSLLLQIAQRAVNRPLLVHPDKLPLILGVIEGRIPLGDISAMKDASLVNIERLPEAAQATMLGPNPSASRFVGSSVDQDPITGRTTSLPYKRTQDGVAVIAIIGSLINRGAWLGSYSGETSYEGIGFQVAHAARDPKAKMILLDIDSPGGEATGCFECAAAIRAAGRAKPVVAVVNGMAASAAYALASAADWIVTTESGVSGSIGCVLLHADYSAKLKKDGITPTLIFAGAHKVDGHPFAPLSEEVTADLQAEVDGYYKLFVSGVAEGRGMSEAAVRATEARTFMGSAAVAAGLADEIGTFETAMTGAGRRRERGDRSSPKSVAATIQTPAPAAASIAVPPAMSPAAATAIVAAAKLQENTSMASSKSRHDGADSPQTVAERVNGQRPNAKAEATLADNGWSDVLAKLNAETARRR